MNPAPRPATADLRATLLTWGPIVAGLAFIYGPSFVDLFRRIWSTDEQAHGPIVLGVACWLVWRNWPAMWARSEGAQTSAAGWPDLTTRFRAVKSRFPKRGSCKRGSRFIAKPCLPTGNSP